MLSRFAPSRISERAVGFSSDVRSVRTSAPEEAEADFLCDEDLGTLIARMLDAPIDEPCHTMELTGANVMTYGDLAEALSVGLRHQPAVTYGKGSESRHYVDVAGQVSDRPFSGVNIIVTRYSDGTTTQVKAIIK